MDLTSLECLSTGWVTMGKKVKQFEKELADYLDVKHCVMVSSGSNANLLAFSVLKWLRTDVRTVTFPVVLWPTTFWAAHTMGFDVEFVDVRTDTFCMEEKHYCTDAVCVVHLLGYPCDVYHDCIIEDACDALGATYPDGKKVGTRGLMGTFSFFYSHHVNTIEGGAVVTNDDDVYHQLVMQRAHGWTRELEPAVAMSYGGCGPFTFASPGFNVRPTEIQAELGLQQIGEIDDDIAARRVLSNTFCGGDLGSGHAHFGLPLLCKSEADRERIAAACKSHQIDVRPVMSGNFARQPCAELIGLRNDFPNADQIHERGLYVALDKGVIEAVKPYARALG